MDITFEIGSFQPSSEILAATAKNHGIVDMGTCCVFRIIRPDGFVPGVAWPSVKPSGSICVGMAAFQMSEGQLTDRQIESTWRHNEAALRRIIAEHFKQCLEHEEGL